MKQILRTLFTEDSGQDLIEYALVTGIVALGLVVIVRQFSANITKIYGALGTSLTTALL